MPRTCKNRSITSFTNNKRSSFKHLIGLYFAKCTLQNNFSLLTRIGNLFCVIFEGCSFYFKTQNKNVRWKRFKKKFVKCEVTFCWIIFVTNKHFFYLLSKKKLFQF